MKLIVQLHPAMMKESTAPYALMKVQAKLYVSLLFPQRSGFHVVVGDKHTTIFGFKLQTNERHYRVSLIYQDSIYLTVGIFFITFSHDGPP